MKKLLLSFLFVASTAAFAQEMTPKKLVLIDGMIASEYLVNSDKSNVVKANVYTSADKIPTELKSFENYASEGITNVKVKENYYDQISIAELNNQLQLERNTPAYVDGNLISNTELKIIANAMKNFEVKEMNGQKLMVVEFLTN